MNAKLCKRLRREARAQTVGKRFRRLMMVGQVAYRPTGERRFAEGAINDPETTRGVYRILKKAHRATPPGFRT